MKQEIPTQSVTGYMECFCAFYCLYFHGLKMDDSEILHITDFPALHPTKTIKKRDCGIEIGGDT